MDPQPPVPLVAAAVSTGLQGAVLLVYAVLEILHVSTGGATVGVTTAVFFAAYAAALLFCARGLFRASTWSRGPVVVTELIALLLAYDFLGGGTTPVAVVLGVVAVLTLGCLLHPATTQALTEELPEGQ